MGVGVVSLSLRLKDLLGHVTRVKKKKGRGGGTSNSKKTSSRDLSCEYVASCERDRSLSGYEPRETTQVISLASRTRTGCEPQLSCPANMSPPARETHPQGHEHEHHAFSPDGKRQRAKAHLPLDRSKWDLSCEYVASCKRENLGYEPCEPYSNRL